MVGNISRGSIMVLLACTAETDKLVPLVIVKGEIHCFKNITTRKAWITQAISTGYSRELDATASSQNRKILLFMDQCATNHQDSCYIKYVKVVFFPQNCTIFQPPDQGIIMSVKHVHVLCSPCPSSDFKK
jgi:hypothetical protein